MFIFFVIAVTFNLLILYCLTISASVVNILARNYCQHTTNKTKIRFRDFVSWHASFLVDLLSFVKDPITHFNSLALGY